MKKRIYFFISVIFSLLNPRHWTLKQFYGSSVYFFSFKKITRRCCNFPSNQDEQFHPRLTRRPMDAPSTLSHRFFIQSWHARLFSFLLQLDDFLHHLPAGFFPVPLYVPLNDTRDRDFEIVG